MKAFAQLLTAILITAAIMLFGGWYADWPTDYLKLNQATWIAVFIGINLTMDTFTLFTHTRASASMALDLLKVVEAHENEIVNLRKQLKDLRESGKHFV